MSLLANTLLGRVGKAIGDSGCVRPRYIAAQLQKYHTVISRGRVLELVGAIGGSAAGDFVFCFPRLHLLAHGLGNRVTLLALREAHKDMVPPVIGELILASADVGVDTDFAPVKALLPRMCHAVTQYYNPTDKALKLSAGRIVHNEARVGRV